MESSQAPDSSIKEQKTTNESTTSQQEIPGDQSIDQPDENLTDVPAKPVAPAQPDAPTQLDTPAQPYALAQPDAPTQPDTPAEPEAPAQPATSMPLIDIQKFAEHAAVISTEHISQASQNNKNKLQELVNNQVVLLESLQHENEKFSANDCFQQMEDMLSKCKHYNSKLLKIQKTMHDITLRTAKVKKQCLKLQELKAKSSMEEEEAKRKEVERENLLVARPAAADSEQTGS